MAGAEDILRGYGVMMLVLVQDRDVGRRLKLAGLF
jgi:hypothetical protein